MSAVAASPSLRFKQSSNFRKGDDTTSSIAPSNQIPRASERNVMGGHNLASFLGNDFNPGFGNIFGNPQSIVDPIGGFASMINSSNNRGINFSDKHRPSSN